MRDMGLMYGVGIYEKGKYTATKDGRPTREYNLWKGMLQRGYCAKFHEKQPTYIDVEVSKELLNFQNFAEIITKIPFYDEVDFNGRCFQCDKDLFNIKEYHKNTIVFIPHSINSFFTNAKQNKGEFPTGVVYRNDIKKYRTRMSIDGKYIHLGNFMTKEEAYKCYCDARNKQAKVLAQRYKGKIENRVYNTLINYDEELWI